MFPADQVLRKKKTEAKAACPKHVNIPHRLMIHKEIKIDGTVALPQCGAGAGAANAT